MMAKISKGASFAGCVKYITNPDKAELLATNGVRLQNWQSAAASFEAQATMNPRLNKKVCHISLNFSAQDGEQMTNAKMVLVAHDYMKAMGIGNTQYMIARHKDRDHPHIHIVFNRVDNDGRTISDKNDRFRSEKICKELTLKHGLYMSSGKENVKRHRLREPDATKYRIYDSLVKNVPLSKSWAELERRLKADGISVGFKNKGSTAQVEGVRFTANNLSFNGSKVDRQFSYSKIDFALKQNARQHEFAQRQTLESAQHHSHGSGAGVVGALLDILPGAADQGVPQHEETLAERRKGAERKRNEEYECNNLKIKNYGQRHNYRIAGGD